MSFEGLKGRVNTIPQVDSTLTKEGYSADAKVTGDKISELQRTSTKYGNDIESLKKNSANRAYMHPTSEEHGNTGRCSFDITSYMDERILGIITVCGSENKTRLAVVAMGTNFICEPLMMVLTSSPELNVTLVGSSINVEVTSGGCWGADLTLFRTPAII